MLLITSLVLKAPVDTLKCYLAKFLGMNGIKSQNVFKISCLTGQERITVVKDKILNADTTNFQYSLI